MKVCTTCGSEFGDDQKFCPNDGSALRGAGGTTDLIDSIVAERYHITKKLGEGGMGAVYLGEHVKMGRKSAIKVMSQSMAIWVSEVIFLQTQVLTLTCSD